MKQMKQISLTYIEIFNFKGISDVSIKICDDRNTVIRGTNGTGKTTLYDAFCWVFFDRDSRGNISFPIEPHGVPHNHTLKTGVIMHIQIINKTYKFQKYITPKYTKKKNLPEKTRTGTENTFFIDGKPMSRKKFYSTADAVFSGCNSQLYTDPTFFAGLHWQTRRNILTGLIADQKPYSELVNGYAELNQDVAVLTENNWDDVGSSRVNSMHSRDTAEKAIEKISANIEYEKKLSESVDPDIPDAPQSEYDELMHKKDGFSEDLRQLDNNEAVSLKRIRINEIEADRFKVNLEQDKKNAEQRDAVNADIEKIEAWRLDAAISVRVDETKKVRVIAAIKNTVVDLTQIREEWLSENNTAFKNEKACITCGQAIPEEMAESNRAAFNAEKSSRLENLSVRGDALKTDNEKYEVKLDKVKLAVDLNSSLEKELEKKLTDKQQELHDLYEPSMQYMTEEEIKMDIAEDVLLDEIREIEKGSTAERTSVSLKLTEITHQILDWECRLNARKSMDDSTKRIKKLENEQKERRAEWDEHNQKIQTFDALLQKKYEVIERLINYRFKIAKFKLFKTLKNGRTEECCDIMCDGIMYEKSLNSGQKIHVGIDIINTLAEYNQFRSVIWIDNKESVAELPETKCQTISLVVDPKFYVLTQEEVK